MTFNSINCYCGIEMKKKDNYNILILNNFLFFTMFPVVRLYSQRTHLYVKHTHLSMVFGYENKIAWEKDN